MDDATATASPAQPPKEEAGLKELFENIAIALILAFMFRAFVVEAYVIPTGSMAPTLLGAHMRFTDPDTGYEFTTNYSGRSLPDGNVYTPPYAVRLDPNTNQTVPESFNIVGPTGYARLPLQDAADPDNDATAPPVYYGDRILVMKYVYLLHEPERWDVVVFKNPDTTNADPDLIEPYQQNYIKRLIGLPGETLMILDGDLYVSRSEKPKGQLTPEDFIVATKGDQAQQALWRIVYDHDYRTQSPGLRALSIGGGQLRDTPYRNPWAVDGGSVDFDAGADERRIDLDATAQPVRLEFDPQTAGYTRYAGGFGGRQIRPEGAEAAVFPMLTDWLAYNQTGDPFRRNRTTPPNLYLDGGATARSLSNIKDVRLELDYRRTAGDGPLTLGLTRREHQFTARLTASGSALTMAVGDAPPITLATSDRGISDGQWAHVELWSVDYQVQLRIDGDIVLQTTPEQYGPDIAALMDDFNAGIGRPKPQITLAAENQSAQLRHLKLWRDVHYLNRGDGIVWATPAAFPAGTIRLGDDEFFVLGDNTALSSDARYWKNPVELTSENLQVGPGRVPGRFMLGKAFFVYWPAGHNTLDGQTTILPRALNFVPNFGQMRFVH
jgi:signal peptidase I